METIIRAIERYRFMTSSEAELQDAIESVLERERFVFDREVRLSPRDRIDFMVEGGIGIEVKVAGSLAALTRQLHRYAQHEAVKGIIVVTTTARHCGIPRELNGKPVRLVSLLGVAL